MTKKTDVSIIVDRPVETVWEFISDLQTNGPKYEPDLIEKKQTSPGPARVGSTFQSKRSKYPRIVSFRTTEYEPNSKLTLEFTNTPLSGSTQSLSVENLDGKTRLTLTLELKLGGFYRIVGPFVARSFKRQNKTILSNIKRILESEARP
jgi:carbon monoxide dehydrogenase subunit G